jgi:SAM-dependent methyltransferase
VLGRLIWGTDTSAFYRDIARLSEVPADARVLDIACGGGVAFRGLRPEQELDYVAADLSPVMLGRARAEADRRGIHSGGQDDARSKGTGRWTSSSWITSSHQCPRPARGDGSG